MGYKNMSQSGSEGLIEAEEGRVDSEPQTRDSAWNSLVQSATKSVATAVGAAVAKQVTNEVQSSIDTALGRQPSSSQSTPAPSKVTEAQSQRPYDPFAAPDNEGNPFA